jgi:hypothetical protein
VLPVKAGHQNCAKVQPPDLSRQLAEGLQVINAQTAGDTDTQTP